MGIGPGPVHAERLGHVHVEPDFSHMGILDWVLASLPLTRMEMSKIAFAHYVTC